MPCIHMQFCIVIIVVVTDRGKERCVDPEGNGVTMSGWVEGEPGPPSGEQDKLSVCSRGGDKTSMGKPKGQLDGLDATSRPYHAQNM
jgi:hypothetical protein